MRKINDLRCRGGTERHTAAHGAAENTALAAVDGPIDQAVANTPIYNQGITDVALGVALPIRFPESGSCAGERCGAT
jgi:hypothetical protein